MPPPAEAGMYNCRSVQLPNVCNAKPIASAGTISLLPSYCLAIMLANLLSGKITGGGLGLAMLPQAVSANSMHKQEVAAVQ